MAEEALTRAVGTARETLTGFEATLRSITDGDLHRADPDGGWTVAQVVSHMHLSGLLWIAALERLRHADHLFVYREEVGHDVLGAAPHSAEEAAGRIGSLRVALETCLPAVDPAVLTKTMEVPPFGTLGVGVVMGGILAHLAGHAEQARGILRKRGALGA